MSRLHLMNRARFVLTGWPSTTQRPLKHFTSKYQSISARNIAVLTEDLRNEAERNGGLKSLDSLPGPKTIPFIGNLEHLRKGFLKIHVTQLEDAKKYGPMYMDKIFANRAMVVQDPDVCKEIYRAEGRLPYRDFSTVLGEFMKEKQKLEMPTSLVELNGEEWAELRRKFHKKMLAPGNVKVYYPLFSDVAIEAIDFLKSLRDENSVVNDVRESVLGKWALESIGKFVYGFRTGLLDQTLTEENTRFYEGIKCALANSMVLSRSKWMKYIYRKKYNDLKDGVRNWYKIGMKHTKTVVDLVEAAGKTGKALDENIANSLICYLMLHKNMNIDECSSHAIEMYGAGYDTTSITTSWLLYWLGMNPDKQEILYNEVIDKIPEDGRITGAAVQQMPYLRACIKESARLTPLAFNNVRVFDEDMVLRGYIIPAQTQIFLSNYNMGRDENVYPNANSFVPERWLRENKADEEIHPYASLPFGYGARSCLGRRIAEAEMQVFLAQIVKNLKIKYIGEENDGEMALGLSLPNTTFALYDR